MATLSLIGAEGAGQNSGKDNYVWKILIFGILGIILAFAIGFSTNKIFLHESVIGLSATLVFLLALILFLIDFSLESLFAQSLRWPMIILQSLAVVAGLYFGRPNNFWIWQLSWIAIFILFFWFGRHLMQTAAEDMLKLRWQRITKKGLAQLLTVFALFISVSLGVFLWQRPNNEIMISESALTSILNSGNFVVHLYLKDFDWKMKTDDFLKIVAEKVVNSSLEKMLGKSLEGLPAAYVENQKQAFIEQNIPSLKNQISQFVGFTIRGQDSLAHVAYQFVYGKLRNLPASVNQIIVIVFVVVVFIALRALAALVSVVARFLGYLLYEILLAVGFVHLIYEGRTKESVVLS